MQKSIDYDLKMKLNYQFFQNQQPILNIGLTIPGNWSFEIRRISAGEIRRISAGEIWQISGEIHLKSAGFHECELLRDDQV